MKFDAQTLAQPHIQKLQPYLPGMTSDELARAKNIPLEQIVKLASNENPHGMSPAAEAAIQAAAGSSHIYPDTQDLTNALAKHWNVKPDNIILGNGSTDVLDLIARTFLGKGTEAISSQYGFSMYSTLTKAVGASNIIVPAWKFGHDLDGFIAAPSKRTKVIWIANPNNPTGSFVPHPEIQRFLAKVPRNVIVVLDEAYYEYLRLSEQAARHTWIRKHPNLVIVRTFSKIYGLAGLRMGYGIGHSSVLELMNRIRQPCNVNYAGLAAALSALGDQAYVQRVREWNLSAIRQLRADLSRLGLECMPSHGNFLTVKMPETAKVHEQLLARGIIVRPLQNYGMDDWLRISVGLPDENRRLVAALTQILGIM